MSNIEDIAQIDYNYSLLKQIALSYVSTKSPLDSMIDDACGVTEMAIKQSKECLETIIMLKERNGYDASGDKMQLANLVKITPQKPTQND